MRNHDRLTQMYRGLNIDQLASMAFHYLADANDLELSRLTDAVPRKSYTCPDVAYEARFDAFRRFAAWWGIEHWYLRCRKAETLGAALAALRRNDQESADDLLNQHERTETYLLALDEVLLRTCSERGIDPVDVRKMSGAVAFKPSRDNVTPNAEFKAALLDRLPKMLER